MHFAHYMQIDVSGQKQLLKDTFKETVFQ
jgi:hypothetical protein